jgi:hypothetical protein
MMTAALVATFYGLIAVLGGLSAVAFILGVKGL